MGDRRRERVRATAPPRPGASRGSARPRSRSSAISVKKKPLHRISGGGGIRLGDRLQRQRHERAGVRERRAGADDRDRRGSATLLIRVTMPSTSRAPAAGSGTSPRSRAAARRRPHRRPPPRSWATSRARRRCRQGRTPLRDPHGDGRDEGAEVEPQAGAQRTLAEHHAENVSVVHRGVAPTAITGLASIQLTSAPPGRRSVQAPVAELPGARRITGLPCWDAGGSSLEAARARRFHVGQRVAGQKS